MGRLVVLKLGRGNVEQGCPVTLQIGEDNAPSAIEITGELPPDSDIPQHYNRWQTIYRSLDFPGRPVGLPKAVSPQVTVEDCDVAARQLRDRFNEWLDARSFRRIREKWLEQLEPTDVIRAVIQSDDPQLRRLPWHLWDLMERYPKAEIALSPLDFSQQPGRTSTPSSTVRILAILGNSKGIDIQKDRAVLEQLSDADVTFLVEPERQDLSDQLWEQSWEILFFAGHSASQGADEAGLIHLNQTESLTISQLKHALEKAVERGLKLAIFNSCDGLGLARELAYLQIPQLIVMREPVPDRVAQEFLKYFLSAYSQAEVPLYLAVKEARQRLQGLEGQFPCATWLPVICQHPAETPPTWQELKRPFPLSPSSSPSSPPPAPKLKLLWVLLVSIVVTGLLAGVRYLGVLHRFELQAFDQLIQLRPKEPQDTRLLVIEVTEKDVNDQNQQDSKKPRDISLSNRSLSHLLEKLKRLQPAVIGLDIYRRDPVGEQFPTLATELKQSDHLVAVCQRDNPNSGDLGMKPPPEIPADQALNRLGFSDTVPDQDGIVRRHLLTMEPSSICPADYSLSVSLALHYLQTKGITLQFTPEGNWQLGRTLIKAIEFPIGGYFNIDGRGYQILLNYRSPENYSSSSTPDEIAPRISLGKALADGLTIDNVKNRIVIIGTTASSFKDYSSTPYRSEQGSAQEIPGVMLQAQMTSQLISAVLDGRPLLWAMPFWAEVIWMGGWSIVGGLLVFYLRRFPYLSLASGMAIAILYSICLGLLVQFGGWVPLVPAALSQLASSSSVVAYRVLLARRQSLSTVPQE